jgi:hypothetical protein
MMLDMVFSWTKPIPDTQALLGLGEWLVMPESTITLVSLPAIQKLDCSQNRDRDLDAR